MRRWDIVNGTIRNKLQWNFDRNIIIQENTFENVVWKISAILSRPQYVNKTDGYQGSALLNTLMKWLQFEKNAAIIIGTITWVWFPVYIDNPYVITATTKFTLINIQRLYQC